MRPSRRHFDESIQQEISKKEEVKNDDEPKEMKVQYTRIESTKEKQQRITYAQMKKAQEEEEKISLTVHGHDSDLIDQQTESLLCKTSDVVSVETQLYSYINELKENAKPPQYSTKVNNLVEAYERGEKHLNLVDFHYKNGGEQVYLLLFYGHILSTSEIKNRSTNCHDNNQLFKSLTENGYLIQNRWISKSRIHYSGYKELIRDIILYYFYKEEEVDPMLFHQFYINFSELNVYLIILEYYF